MHPRRKASQNSSTSYGLNMKAAPPTTSGSEVAPEHKTGVPQAIASKGGSPNPSNREGYTNANAPLYKAGKSSSGKYPVKTTFFAERTISFKPGSANVLARSPATTSETSPGASVPRRLQAASSLPMFFLGSVEL